MCRSPLAPRRPAAAFFALAVCLVVAAIVATTPVMPARATGRAAATQRDRGSLHVAPLPPAWTVASLLRPASPRSGTSVSPPGPMAAPHEIRAAPGRDPEGMACLRKLARLRVPFRVARPTRGIQTPVIITGPLRGVRLTSLWGNRPALMDCRFALTLIRIAPLVLSSGFNELCYSSVYSYRNVAHTHHLSRHSFGLAIDVFELKGPGGLHINVEKDWKKAIGRPGNCIANVSGRKARLLRGLVCRLERSGLLHLVLSPDSNYAHRNHLHISGLRAGERPHRRNRWAGRRLGQRLVPRRVTRRSRRHRRARRHGRARRHHRIRRRHDHARAGQRARRHHRIRRRRDHARARQ